MRSFLYSTCICLLSWGALSALEDTPPYTLIEDKAKAPILTPTLAERKIGKLQLANGMKAYLISDPKTPQSAASLVVEAGAWKDPKTYPGMAHFLEHMLFLGTKAYPQEGEFMEYISDHAGTTNAYTAPDRTVYLFSVNSEAFKEALERFSHFFQDPLLADSSLQKELLAVEQEYAKNKGNDAWRSYMVFKATSNPHHPYAAFATGNSKTLAPITHATLQRWFQSHYTPDKMTLIALSPLPLSELTSLIARHFSPISLASLRTPSLLPEEQKPLTAPQQKGHLTFIKPLQEKKTLSLTWEMPPIFAQAEGYPIPLLLASILESKSPDSLLGLLKKEDLAENLSIENDRLSKRHLLFTIEITLTDKGLVQKETVIRRCFQALACLKQGIPSYLFDEWQQIALASYTYQVRQDPYQTVYNHADAILYEDLSTYPEKTLIPSSFAPALWQDFLSHLTPEACIYFFQAPPSPLKNRYPLRYYREKWMQVEYAVQKIDKKRLATWKKAQNEPLPILPPPNPYIPENLSLPPQIKSPPQAPTLLFQGNKGKVYFAQDTAYGTPEATAIFSLKSPLLDYSVKNTTLAILYLYLLQENLSGTFDAAQKAHLTTTLLNKPLRIQIGVEGYAEKLPLFVERLFLSLKGFQPTQEEFTKAKEQLLRAFANQEKKLPLYQAHTLLATLIYPNRFLPREHYTALHSTSYEELQLFSQDLWTKAYLEGMLYGALDMTQAQTLIDKVDVFSPYPLEEHPPERGLELPADKGPFALVHTTPQEGSGAILLLDVGAYTRENRAAHRILSCVLKQAFFDTLRTKQQTAYIAQSDENKIQNTLFQIFSLQSSSHSVYDLLNRMEGFLEDFVQNFTTLFSEKRFAIIREALLTELQEPPLNLLEKGWELAHLACEEKGDFALREKESAALKQLTYASLVDFVQKSLASSNRKRVSLLFSGPLDSTMPKKGDREKLPSRYQQIDAQKLRLFSASH